ncbi:SLAC1 anion channel family protein [Propionivibrio dicarboxylicus]|uniref:Tellurite resistance protein n=1 Tax=Propionivibrio dicarboxylicus TaxID=83767 RepID=A0A1G8AGK8_9RHOO|nr:SLAC1 anion channel family protein [Propionivibrio dicarboxylicus]SDH20027.1 tellurite resistance protein [Propionivibrio dicarboxylicus]
MQTAASPEALPPLAYFPVPIFSSVMGTCGLALAWQRAGEATPALAGIWPGIAALATGIFLALLLLYTLKLVRHQGQVVAEWRHPVRVNFFPAISISILLLSVVWRDTLPSLAFFLWCAGAVLHLGFTLAILSSWIFHTHYDIHHANPAWFIPVVGNLFVPINAAAFGLAEVGWFYFSIGFVFWLVMMTIVLYRVFFHDPIAPRLLPTLFILIAPPAVGFLAYQALGGSLDAFARVLYGTALFVTLLLAVNARRFLQLGFFLSSWAYSFPLAAITIASFVMAQRSGHVFFIGLAFGLLAVVTVVITTLLAMTVRAALRRTLCIPE